MLEKIRVDPEVIRRLKSLGMNELQGTSVNARYYLALRQTLGVPRYIDPTCHVTFGKCALLHPWRYFNLMRRKEGRFQYVRCYGNISYDMSIISKAMWLVGRRKSAVLGIYHHPDTKGDVSFKILTISHGRKMVHLAPAYTGDKHGVAGWAEVFDHVPNKIEQMQVWYTLEGAHEEAQ